LEQVKDTSTSEKDYANFEAWLNTRTEEWPNAQGFTTMLQTLERKFQSPPLFKMSTINLAALLTAVDMQVTNNDQDVWLPPTNWVVDSKLSKSKRTELREAIHSLLIYKIEQQSKKRRPYKWTEAKILSEANKHGSLSEFAKANQTAYKACRQNKACLKKVQEMMFKKKMSKL
jgi:hypothetical protein